MANPSLRIQLSGTGVTSLDNTSSWALENKLEDTYSLNVTDGSLTLDFSNIENMKLLIFEGSGSYIVTLNQIDSASESIPITIDYNCPFVLPTTQAFIDTLSSVQISTSSTTDVTITVRAYGEDAS